jgi:hypothetical protein
MKIKDVIQRVREMGTNVSQTSTDDTPEKEKTDPFAGRLKSELGENYRNGLLDRYAASKSSVKSALNEIVSDDFFDGVEEENHRRDDSFHAIAWYRSFHYDVSGGSLDRWGIYIRKPSFLAWCRKMKCFENELDARLWMLHLLLAHEHYHYFVDIAATTLEELYYLYYGPKKIYIEYGERVYQPQALGKELVLNSMLPHEESMANAFSFRYLTNKLTRWHPANSSTIMSEIHTSMKRQPKGYCSFDQFLTDDAYVEGNRLMVATLWMNAVGGSIPADTSFLNRVVLLEKLLYPRNFNNSPVPVYWLDL